MTITDQAWSIKDDKLVHSSSTAPERGVLIFVFQLPPLRKTDVCPPWRRFDHGCR